MYMRYIQNGLLEREKLVYAVRPHWIIFSHAVWMFIAALLIWQFAPLALHSDIFGRWTLRDLTSAILTVTSLYHFFSAYIYYETSEYGVTNKRVVMKIGLIYRKSLEIMLDKVEGVSVNQSIMGRIFDYGEITIIGTGGTNDSFLYIPSPLEFRKKVQQQVDYFEEGLRPKGN